mmetsp:Transcript_17326/g.37669  ORF Transcript_17326/g.37669 Transcript_17326/m.37669 type:complete len:208 (-) Transcript_17326:1552-2175(-)
MLLLPLFLGHPVAFVFVDEEKILADEIRIAFHISFIVASVPVIEAAFVIGAILLANIPIRIKIVLHAIIIEFAGYQLIAPAAVVERSGSIGIHHAIVRVKLLADIILVAFQLLLIVARSHGAKAAFEPGAVTLTNIPILIQVRIETMLLEVTTHGDGSHVVVLVLVLLRNDDGIGAFARNPIGINHLLIFHQDAAAVIRLTLLTRIR